MTALTPAQQARKADAFAALAASLSEGIAETCELFAIGGPEAVAEAAWLPGGPSAEELAARARRHFVPVTRDEAA